MEISNQIIAVLDNICEKFGIAIDWTAANALPYVQDSFVRIIKYEIATSVAWIVICAITGFFTLRLVLKTIKNFDEYDFIVIFGITIIIIATIVILYEIFDIITAVTIPEKTIYYFLKPMLNKGC